VGGPVKTLVAGEVVAINDVVAGKPGGSICCENCRTART